MVAAGCGQRPPAAEDVLRHRAQPDVAFRVVDFGRDRELLELRLGPTSADPRRETGSAMVRASRASRIGA